MKARHEFRTEQEYQEYLIIYFAALAMQGYYACREVDMTYEMIAERSVGAAYVLINALNEPNT